MKKASNIEQFISYWKLVQVALEFTHVLQNLKSLQVISSKFEIFFELYSELG